MNLRGSPTVLDVWASLGTFNLILRATADTPGRSAIEDVSRWATAHTIANERWIIEDGLIKNWIARPLHPIRPTNVFNKLSALSKLPFDNSLNIHAQEYLVLMASALSRSASVLPMICGELAKVAVAMAETIEDASQHPEDLLDLSAELINLNAALSRFSSQAFSGISPIVTTECHFWIHSLLGTGSANLALANLVEFITQRLGQAMLPERFIALKEVTRDVPKYTQLVSDDDFLWRDHIGDIVLADEVISEPLQPIVTYFSGRDGYSSQLQTLSAPLTSIAQANSLQTNILTVTHEISHVFVEGILGYLYPDPDDKDEIVALTQFVVSEQEPTNMFEAARKLLTEAVINMEQLYKGDIDNRSITPDHMLEMLTHWRREAKEIMVHTFDYLYFFRDEPERYIESIWSTWCAIPGISERIPEYILRSLCAISPRLLKQLPADRRASAHKALAEVLARVSAAQTATPDYAKKALKYLDENWSVGRNGTPSISRRFDIWLYLVRLVTAFMHSPRVGAELFSDPDVTTKSTKHKCVYDDNPVGNPIRFVREHLNRHPSEAESLWLLHNVAVCLRLPR